MIRRGADRRRRWAVASAPKDDGESCSPSHANDNALRISESDAQGQREPDSRESSNGKSDRTRQLPPGSPEHFRGRGGGSPAGATRFEFLETPAIGRSVIEVAQRLLQSGLSSAEVCSLFTHAASALARLPDGLDRQEWLDLCVELHGKGELVDIVVTAPGGSS